ncbi:MAG: NAD-dependent epimerase/dehydratase family protein, partial [Alicyclobacillus sp.]|nr:NAD-dependent epimerase/dehydratase family protein [Alicyclobacillus sp.]
KLRSDGRPSTEADGFNDPDRVVSTYKRTKVLAERLVMDAAALGMDVVIVNPSTPVGPYDVKPTPTGRIVLDTMRGKMPGYVETGLNLVAVEDVALGHLLAYQRGRAGERYILGNQNLHLSEILAMVAELSGRKAPKVRIPLWVAWCAAAVDEYMLTPIRGGPPRIPLAGVSLAKHQMYLTAAKAVRDLGLAQTAVREALAQAVDWFRKHPVNGSRAG